MENYNLGTYAIQLRFYTTLCDRQLTLTALSKGVQNQQLQILLMSL